MERLDGLDEEVFQDEAKKDNQITSFEESKKKRKPFHYWTVDDMDHKMKLTTSMITKLENKYKTNIMTLVTASDIPPLSIMLTIAQAAISPWEHGVTFGKIQEWYETWLEEGGSQADFLMKIIVPTMAVSGFFTESQAELILKEIKEADTLI